MRRRHADVDDRNVRLVHRHVPQQVLGRPRLGDDLESGLLEQARDTLAQEHGVVGEHDPTRVSELRHGAPKRREVAWKAVGDHLVDPLGVRQAL